MVLDCNSINRDDTDFYFYFWCLIYIANASSKGHLAVVQFLITKHKANPFLRNAYQETAFDLAASVFEILICSLLASYESSLYSTIHSNSTIPYNPLLSHSTIPIILHENQRLSRPSLKRLSSLGNLSGNNPPRWSSKALSLKDQRAAFSMPIQIGFSSTSSNTGGGGGGGENRPVFRSEVGLPLIGNEGEFVLPLVVEKKSKGKGKGVAKNDNGGRPSRSRSVSASSVLSETSPSSVPPTSTSTSTSKLKGTRRISATSSLSAVLGSTSASASPLVDSITPSNSHSHSSALTQIEPAWFWLSDWVIDTTDLSSSTNDGWSYATSFDAPIEEWNSELSNELLEALENNGFVGGGKFVRRRRWVRVMRRRLDIPNWGFIGESNSREENEIEMEEEMGESSGRVEPNSDADYLVKALFLAGELHSRTTRLSSNSSIKSGKTAILDEEGPEDGRGDLNRSELRKVVARLERATNELRIGMLTDEDSLRRRKASDQFDLYLHQLGLIKEELGLHHNDDDDEDDNEDEDNSDDEFVYNGRDAQEEDDEEDDATPSIASTKLRSSSIKSRSSYLSQQSNRSPSGSSSQPPLPDLQPQLSRAPEFRVPTHETSIKIQQYPQQRNNQPPTTAIWESDTTALQCQDCSKTFSFFLRRHHCRNCGKVFCNPCSSNSDRILFNYVVKEPGISLDTYPQFGRYRTCDACHLLLSQPIVSVASLTAFFPNPHPHPNNNSPNSPIINSTRILSSSSVVASGGGTSSPLISGSESGQSDASELQECPVCGQGLSELGSKEVQESHVQNCLEVGGGAIARNGSYLVFKLPPGPLG